MVIMREANTVTDFNWRVFKWRNTFYACGRREWEGGEVGYHSQPHLKVFPLKPQQMEHMSLHLPTGQTLQKATSRTCLGKSPFIVSDAADLPSAVEGAGDAIPLTNAR